MARKKKIAVGQVLTVQIGGEFFELSQEEALELAKQLEKFVPLLRPAQSNPYIWNSTTPLVFKGNSSWPSTTWPAQTTTMPVHHTTTTNCINTP